VTMANRSPMFRKKVEGGFETSGAIRPMTRCPTAEGFNPRRAGNFADANSSRQDM